MWLWRKDRPSPQVCWVGACARGQLEGAAGFGFLRIVVGL